MTAADLDKFLNGVLDKYGYTNSTLRNTGQAFIDAAKTYNVNEVYLLAHAILESAWGTSMLARGVVSNYEGYYNFFGIGAYDKDPNNGGAAMAKICGWDTPYAAIMGAAQWISNGVSTADGSFYGCYLNSEWSQNTLYKMRWNVAQAAANGNVWKQYATARTWAVGIAELMDEIYYSCGLTMADSGLRFEIPRYVG